MFCDSVAVVPLKSSVHTRVRCCVCGQYDPSRPFATSKISKYRYLVRFSDQNMSCNFCYTSLLRLGPDDVLVRLPSKIPKAGHGVFALKKILKNEITCDYVGLKLSKSQADACEVKSHLRTDEKGTNAVITDGSHVPLSAPWKHLGSIINHSENPNCDFFKNRSEPFQTQIKSLTTIEPGTELLLFYSRDYEYLPTSTSRAGRPRKKVHHWKTKRYKRNKRKDETNERDKKISWSLYSRVVNKICRLPLIPSLNFWLFSWQCEGIGSVEYQWLES